MLPLLSNCSFCPVTPHHKPMHFPLLLQRTGPLLLTLLDAGSSFCPGLRLLAHPVEQGSTAPCRARSRRGLLASCHVPLQMWQQFSGRLRDSSTQLHTPINIWQKCILSLFVYSLLNTIMVSSCIAGGPIHWNFTVDFISLWVAFFFLPSLLYYKRISSHFAWCLWNTCLTSPVTPVFYYLSLIILIPHLLCRIWKSPDKPHPLLKKKKKSPREGSNKWNLYFSTWCKMKASGE